MLSMEVILLKLGLLPRGQSFQKAIAKIRCEGGMIDVIVYSQLFL
jgi:hypothetical protein